MTRLLAIAAVAGTLASPAIAQNYRWCSNFADGAGTNCGWTTLEQCMITVRGSGGYCSENDAAKPAAASSPAQRRSTKHHAAKNS